MGNSNLYNKLFAKLYDRFMNGFEKGLFKYRNELVSQLKGEVLEVGSGTGINFVHYHNEAKVTALEPSGAMIKVSRRKKCNSSNIVYLQMGITDENLSNHLHDHSFDFIISTLVLCTVPDPEKAISNYRRLLKPGGKLIVLEHIHSSRKRDRGLQNLANPFWKAFSGGCNLNRNTDELLLYGGFKPVNQEYFVKTLRWVKGIYEV